MKKAALHNLGCKVNAYETEVMQQLLEKDGYEIVPFDELADVYIINTCTVTNIADRKSRQMLHRAKKMNPEAVVVAVGCYVQAAKEVLEEDQAVDIVIGNNKKNELIEILDRFFAEAKHIGTEQAQTAKEETVIDINHTDEYECMELVKTSEHTRAYIKVQDGCNQFCSYCIIPYARGRVRSRREEEVLAEVTRLAENGYKEIVVTGIHLSSYGIDFEDAAGVDLTKSHLLSLLMKLHEVNGIERIRIGSLEPRIITEEFAVTLSTLPKVCPHFHLSLQSGCDATLKRMNRRYDTSEFYEKCLLLRKYFKAPAITTDVIVGFPGENEEEFETTRTFLEKAAFYEMHVFKYSKRNGTKAAVMENQVPEQVKSVRSEQLLAMTKKHSEEYRKKFIGQEITILIEESMEIDGLIYQVGYTKEYIKAAIQTSQEVNVLIKAKAVELLNGEILRCIEEGVREEE